MAKSLCKTVNPVPENLILKWERVRMETNDAIIRSNGFYCNKNHEVTDVAGIIRVVDKRGTIEEHLVPIAYCKTCNLYYMLEETYSELKRSGVILHTVMTKIQYRNYTWKNNGDLNPMMWKEESPLKIYGYSVGQQDDLSDEQRQAVLEMIIDNGIMSQDRVLSYLDFFIRLHGNENSTSKWQEDRRHIANYNLGSKTRIRVGALVVHSYL